MDIEDAIKMTKIDTQYILLPRRLIFKDNLIFAGYTTPFIEGHNTFLRNTLINSSIDELTDIFNKLYSDVYTLSINRIIITDIIGNEDNLIFNGSFYLLDPGYYYFSDWSVSDILPTDSFSNERK